MENAETISRREMAALRMPALETTVTGYLRMLIPFLLPIIPFPSHLIPTTIDSGPSRCSTLVSWNPASRIQPMQSAPV